ncbi:hypothetical protein J2Z66_001511 [Paenibacillus eucommiae]|uniref:Uncharacterized protein n=1 Tax=Paenibacillus eucommiae TaxID=1355755 RepID=A0ABS4IQR2_9BACL|nr:hypothetical protein [Paenibacillus eucommiae]
MYFNFIFYMTTLYFQALFVDELYGGVKNDFTYLNCKLRLRIYFF